MTIDLEDLEWFLAIVDEGTFGRAAEMLGVSQPSLSRRVASLEKGLGVPLFSRERRQVELTAAGRTLAREARGLLADARIAVDATRGAGRVSGHLRIAYRSAFRYRILPVAMRMMCEAHPDASMAIAAGPYEMLLTQVRSREIDVALMAGPTAPSDLAVEVLRRTALVAALPGEHRLAAQKTIALRELAGEPFISISEAEVAEYGGVLRRICAEAGFTPRIVANADSADMMVACVAAGMGVAVIYGDNDMPIPNAVFRPVRPGAFAIDFMAVYRQGNDNPVLPDFLAFLRQAAAP